MFFVVLVLLFVYSGITSSSTGNVAVVRQKQQPPITDMPKATDIPRRDKSKQPEQEESTELPRTEEVKVWTYDIKAEYPHDPRAYLQGLAYHEGKLYESTGMYGETTVREATPA